MPRGTKTARLNIPISHAEHEAIKAAAASARRSMADWVRLALEEAVERERKKAA